MREIENQKQGYENLKNEEKNKLQSNFLSLKDQINNNHHALIKQLKEEFKERLESAKENLEDKKKNVFILNNKKTEIKYKRYFEVEIEKAKVEISELIASKKNHENQLIHNKLQIEGKPLPQLKIGQYGVNRGFTLP